MVSHVDVDDEMSMWVRIRRVRVDVRNDIEKKGNLNEP